MKKSAVLSSVFTPALTKALKSHRSMIHCQTSGEYVYITNGFFLVKLRPIEYDEFVRPVTQRDPGAWVLDESGQPMEREPMDAARILADYESQDLHPMHPAPFLFRPDDKKLPALSAFHTSAGNFVAFFDYGYSSVVFKEKVTSFRGRSATAPMLAYTGEGPVAMLLPIRIHDDGMISAALAYFTDGKAEKQAKTNAPDPELSAALEEIARLREELARTQKQAPATPEQPANKAAAVLAALESLDGITATVKGAQTSSPVVWVGGNAEAHKAALEKLGAKWSGKRSAYYIQAA